MTRRSHLRARPRTRTGVAGIIAAVILFAILFTTGAGYFLLIANGAQTTNQANGTRQAALQQSSQEKLVLGVGLSTVTDPWGQTGDLWLRVNNTGGVPSTIVDVYVTNTATGAIASNSRVTMGSYYLRQEGTLAQKGDLNVTLPIVLSPGATTKALPGCGVPAGGCDIGISKTSYLYVAGTVVVVSILTANGNVFSAQYPPIPPATTAIATVKQVTSSVVVVSSGGGGSALVVQMAASPPQVLSGGTLTDTVTVYNYASTTVTGVTLTMNPPSVTGTATVTASGACTPSPQNIPGFAGIGMAPSVTFGCTYTALTGAVGGIASFAGYAQGTLGGGTISSAGAVSNTIQIGGTANVPTQGAFTTNFFFFKYSSCAQAPSGRAGSFSYPSACTATPTVMPPASTSTLADGNYLSAGGNQYVAYYVEVTNDFNTTLPILEYSYLFLDPGISGEQFNFLAGTATNPQTPYYPNYCQAGGCGSNNLPTLTAYAGSTAACAETGPSYAPPSPTTCIDVAPGQTVVLTFAACGYGSSNWAWGGAQDASTFDNSAGCTSSPPSLDVPEGLTLGVILSYLYKNNVYTQFMPFEGQIMLRSSSSLVSCSPSTFSAAGSTVCTATVSDSDGTLGGTSTIKPTGTVSFTATSPAAGTFSNGGACTLSGGTGSSASCSVTFTPATGVDGYANATVTYPGDGSHGSSNSSTSLTVTPIITSTLSTSSITVGSSVFGSSSLAAATATAGGTVTYEYFSGSTCGGTATTVSTVTVTNGVIPNSAAHTFTAAGPYSWNAVYSGDANNPGATSPCVTLTVNKITPTIAISISPASVKAGAAVTGSATLTGSTTNAGGSATYEYFTGSSCSGSATTVSTVTVANGVVPNSAAQTFNTAGSFSWLVVYNGDSNNNVVVSTCTSLTVAVATPTVATSLSASTVAAGGSVTDSATLTGSSGTNAGGTVTYTWYSGSSCTSVISSVSVTVTGGVIPGSGAQTFASAGSFSWNAVYSGDANNNPATSPCEPLTVTGAPYVAITITNSQSSPTPNPFQQKIVWNPTTYKTYEASDLGNVRFCLDVECNTPLNAWLESCISTCSSSATSATAWVKLTSPIPATSTLTVYMVFLPTTAEFDGNHWGEAPTLSGTYAQYDNGANVFTFYDNFAGTSLSSKWTSIVGSSGATITVNNGLTIRTTSTASTAYAFVISATQTFPVIAETYTSAGDSILGVSTSNALNGFVAPYSGYSLNWYAGTDYMTYQASSGAGTTLDSVVRSTFPAGIWQLSWSATGAEAFTDGAGNTYAGTNSGKTIANYAIYVGQSNGVVASSVFQWARTRALPPSGVMPSISLGGVVITPSLALSCGTCSGGSAVAHGSTVTLSGTGYVASTTYSYCFTSSTTPGSCITTVKTFVASTAGAIPASTTLVVPASQSAGSYYVIVYKGAVEAAEAAVQVT